MNPRQLIYLVVLMVTLGCARSTVQQQPTPPRVVLVPADSGLRIDSAVYRFSPAVLFHSGNAVYDYRTLSVVRVTTGDSVARVDTTIVNALISAAFQAVGTDSLTIQAAVTVDSLKTRTGSGLPIELAMRIDTVRISRVSGRVSLPAGQSITCDIQAREGLVRVDELIPLLPTSRTGTWTDTLVRQICRAGIQLQARRVTTYQLDSTAADLKLLRMTATTFSGRGVQWNQPVESTGQSISHDTIFFDLTSRRRIERIQGSTRLQLGFKSQLRNQQFEQLTELRVQLK